MSQSHPLLAALAQRGLQAIIVAVIVGVVSFAMMQALPSDAAYRIAAGRYGYDMMDAAAAEAVRQELGLDRHWFAQLTAWLGALATFDLGRSLIYGTPVIDEVATQLSFSLLLATGAVATSILIAVPVSVAAGLRPGSIADRITLGLSIFLRAIPAFALGVVLVLVLVLIFAVQLRRFPVAGFRGVEHLVLPFLTLGLGLAAVSNRVVRDPVVEAMSAKWRLFARTKGLWARATMLRHVLRNASLPVVTYIGVQMAYLSKAS